MADAIDRSSGWEGVAAQFIDYAPHSHIGTEAVRNWCRSLPAGSTVLDLGCGAGAPRSAVLFEEGLTVYAIDAAPSLLAAYRRRFPGIAAAACEAAEASSFFGRRFDAVLAWGLLFLLAPAAQRQLVPRVAAALEPHGRFLFTAPVQSGEWPDMLTGRLSYSLGGDAYRALARDAGLDIVGEFDDEGDNHYFDCRRRTT